MQNRYAKLIGDDQYLSDTVYVQSTVSKMISNCSKFKKNLPNKCAIIKGSDRSLMSAQVTLARLFPPRDDQIWNENLLWNLGMPIFDSFVR